MKSKTRKIVVNNDAYLWSVKAINWEFVSISVWREGVKREPWFQVKKRLDNPWGKLGDITRGAISMEELELKPVTPKLVSVLINKVIDEHGEPALPCKTIQLEIDNDGVLKKC